MFRKRSRTRASGEEVISAATSSAATSSAATSSAAPSSAAPSSAAPSSAAPSAHEITPQLEEETIRFETGNPDTGSISNGFLIVRPCVGGSPIILVESVPGLMTSADFCMFVRPFADAIVHFRPLRLLTERNRYVVVVQLRSPKDAVNFTQVFQGKLFLRGLVQETCEIREVVSIQFDNEPGQNEAGKGKFPTSAMFPEDTATDSQRPSCPVCLEKLDERTAALVTTFCNHTMHAECLAKWDLNRCPVCRHTHELTPEASTCMNCNHREDLWMCVVCAYVGCGVYKNKHAHQHFGETQHPFAMILEDCTFWTGEKIRAGSVWDYSSDRFVNRLLTSEDGKIVEMAHDERNDAAGSSSGGQASDACCGSSSVEPAVTIGDDDEENDRGLQAAVYASRMDAVVDEYRTRLERIEAEHAAEKERLGEQVRQLRGELGESSKERKTLNKRVADAEKEAKNLKEKNGFLKSLNETLLRDKKGWNNEVEKLQRQLSESQASCRNLEEQISDLMTHLEAQAKIAGSSDSCRSDATELQGGDVIRVGPTPRQRLAMKTNRRATGA